MLSSKEINDVPVFRINNNPELEFKGYRDSFNHYHAIIRKNEIFDALLTYTFSDIYEHLTGFNHSITVRWWDSPLDISIYTGFSILSECPKIEISFDSNIKNWIFPFSFQSFLDELDETITNFTNTTIQLNTGLDEYNWEFEFLVESEPESTIVDTALKLCLDICETIINQVLNKLFQSSTEDGILSFFKFPTEIKSACNQYLLYFSQFLKDINYENQVELKCNDCYTLLKVIPKNKNEAINNIYYILKQFLDVPGINNIEVSNTTDLAVLQWKVNIDSLQAQLMLAKTLLQTKDATIESLHLTNYRLMQTLNENVKKEEEEEDLIENIVTLTKYKGKGFTINLPEIFRKIKKFIE
jgi:hypothetical protein